MEVMFFSFVAQAAQEFIDGYMVLICSKVIDAKMHSDTEVVYSNLSEVRLCQPPNPLPLICKEWREDLDLLFDSKPNPDTNVSISVLGCFNPEKDWVRDMEVVDLFDFKIINVNFRKLINDVSFGDLFHMFIEHRVNSVILTHSADHFFFGETELTDIVVPNLILQSLLEGSSIAFVDGFAFW